jgi:histidine triad (HIT) family protein
MAEGCLFCKIAAGEIPSTQVYSDEEFYAFRDVHPAAPSHVLIIPRKHIPAITDAGAADRELLGNLFLAINRVAALEGLAADGFRAVLNCGRWGGQEIPHIHVHLLGGRPLAWPPG